jgi:alpha-glucosidase
MFDQSSDLFERIRFRGNPVAHTKAVVISENARFTVLTPRLIRLEWSETGEFEDRGTYAFPTRYTAAPPAFSAGVEGSTLTIDTGALALRYTPDGGCFAKGNLTITFELNGEPVTWRPGMPNPQNLRGTRRTLDGCEADASLDEGILSRAGWVLFDDSRSVVLTVDDGWVAPRLEIALQDWYLFGYGHDYKGALAEYTQFGGSIPLIPRFVLGAWWSRYWAYSDQDLKDLVNDFAAYDLPLDVLVVDMDWHTPDAWTGYTWNRELFPDPPAFLRWVHDKGLRTTFNLHPAQGVQHFEEAYPRFAEAMGIDPETKETVAFHIADRRFVENYFRLLHHPMEEQGVDFWWVDWQQGEVSEVKGLDPLLWLNHLHFNDARRRGKRPMLYSRWGGLGNHRYYIGFSGDTIVYWSALQFQPYMTATASNVAYGWWSHDIGGHMGGATEPELYARWVQFGALSPCLRLHATKDARAERRPWKYPDPVYRAARAAFHLRYQLVPYIYTMARVACDTSVSLCRPMYYEHPEKDAAYAARDQYYFGNQVIAAPIVCPADVETGLASVDVWLPEGTWIDYQTKESFAGPRWVRLVGDLERMPMLVRAGGIIPLASSFRDTSEAALASGTTDAIPHDKLVLEVFPGPQGAFRLYEDDGITEAYREGQYEWTPIATRMEDRQSWTVEVASVVGRCAALPVEREYAIHFQGSRQPASVTVGGVVTRDWTYNPETLTTTVHVPKHDKRQPLAVTIWNPNGISALDSAHDTLVAQSDVRRLLGDDWTADVDAVLGAGDRPGKLDAIARLGGPFVRFVEFTTPEEAAQQLGHVIVAPPQEGTYDLSVTFSLLDASGKTVHAVEDTGLSEARIIDVPFAFDGQVRSSRWEAEVEITWRGETLRSTHRSKALFPTIYAWRAAVHDPTVRALALDEVVTPEGQVSKELAWMPLVQTAEGLLNVNQPYGAFLSHPPGGQLPGKDLAGYLVTTVVCPDERDAVLAFRAGGACQVYLNGRQVAAQSGAGEQDLLPSLRSARKTKVIRLRAGKNILLVDTRPPTEGRPFWFFGGAFLLPGEGELPMVDLLYGE